MGELIGWLLGPLRQRVAPGDAHREREDRARIILDEMFQFVALLDAQGTVLEVNQTALDASGIPRAEAIGIPLWEERVWPAETRAGLRAAVGRAAGGEFVRYEVDVFMAAGGKALVTIDFSLKPVRDAAGNVVFVLAEGRDIAEKKRAEAEVARKTEELRRLYDRLKELDVVKTQSFANVSHELRSPLALILSATQRLLGSGQLGETERRDLETVGRNARTLLTHVTDLLDIAKLEAGKMTLHRGRVDLARLVRRVASFFEVIARERQVELSVSVPESLGGTVDPQKLERVVVNLLSNAFKFVPERGRVQVALHAEHEAVAVVVEDNGPGVPAALRTAIFDRFRQGEDSTTRRFGGTGLGLSIAKEFVELHGGRIVVGDAPAGGARFRVELPLMPEPLPADEPEASRPDGLEGAAVEEVVRQTREALCPRRQQVVAAGEPRAGLVLVVEDNPEMNRFLAESLTPEYRLVTAFDGREALEKARALRPDLVLTDVMMPEMGGDELVRALRADRELDGTAIVVLTAKADEELRVRLLREGAQDYLTKPFATEELRARVRNLITLKRTRDVLQREVASQGQDLAALAEELSRRQRDLAAANRAKDEFLSTLSHELRTPVTSVLAWLWMLRRGRIDEAGAARALETMEGSVRSLVRIIDDLLDVSRIIRGQLRLEVQPVGLAAVIQAAVDAVLPAAESKGINVETTVDPEALVHGDASRLQQVVWNLLANAIKFTPSGGHVRLRLEPRGSDLRLTVSDTGIGIAPDFLPHVFERFRQADSSTTRERGGLGLGLAIVRHLVELHGGTVTADSPGRDRGATFTVTLPALAHRPPAGETKTAGEPAGEEAVALEGWSLAGLRVLVVDDESHTREALTALLAAAGAEAQASASAAEALEAVRSWRPDVLVADIAMPGEDGYGLVRQMRALAPAQGGGTPALALTAYARAEDRERALAAGFLDYLAKPVDPPTLVATVARLAGAERTIIGTQLGRESPPERRTGASAGWGGTILLVEDDAGTREYGHAVLEQFGYRVLTARSGEEGLRVWRAHRDEIDLVLTDLVMLPGSSGAKVWQTVHEQRADVPVLVLSSYPRIAEILEARREGVVECLEKPVDPEVLGAAVRRALGQAHTQ